MNWHNLTKDWYTICYIKMDFNFWRWTTFWSHFVRRIEYVFRCIIELEAIYLDLGSNVVCTTCFHGLKIVSLSKVMDTKTNKININYSLSCHFFKKYFLKYMKHLYYYWNLRGNSLIKEKIQYKQYTIQSREQQRFSISHYKERFVIVFQTFINFQFNTGGQKLLFIYHALYLLLKFKSVQ